MMKKYQCKVEIESDLVISIYCPLEKYRKITKYLDTGLMCLEEVFDEKGVPHLTFYPPIDVQERELETYEISYFMKGDDKMLYGLPFIGVHCCIVTRGSEETKQYHKIVLNVLNDNRVVKKGDRLQYISNSGFEVIVKEITASGYRVAEDMKSIGYFIDKDEFVYWDVKNDI